MRHTISWGVHNEMGWALERLAQLKKLAKGSIRGPNSFHELDKRRILGHRQRESRLSPSCISLKLYGGAWSSARISCTDLMDEPLGLTLRVESSAGVSGRLDMDVNC